MRVTKTYVGTTLGDLRYLFFMLYEAYNDGDGDSSKN